MDKNDKMIVILGVIVILIASVGVYTWKPGEKPETSSQDFIDMQGVFASVPTAISVSDENPFFPLIVTPLAVHYESQGQQNCIPLYVQNQQSPSDAVTTTITNIGIPITLFITNTKTAVQWSQEIAQTYWKSSTGALIIENSQEGYTLGVCATPLASYLSIPVLVVDSVDQTTRQTLVNLGVQKTLICGEKIEEFGTSYRFKTADDILNFTRTVLLEKFGSINYLTLTNPIDAWPPQVLDRVEYHFGPTTIPSTASTQLINFATKAGAKKIDGWTFTIPADYKYALVKFEGINLDADDVDILGDSVSFQAGPNLPDIPKGLQNFELFVGSTSAGGIPERDQNGKITKDRVFFETVVYDRGGVEYSIKGMGTWLAKKEGRIQAHVVIEKLENPRYPLMKGLSSIAPYLTAYHRGLIFGKPEFVFTADDHIITEKGQTCPGLYVPRKNPPLTPMSNKHIFDTIHKQLNTILARLANINDIEGKNLQHLKEYYTNNPMYIALVGDATVLPQYIYQNYVEPMDYEETQYYVGGGTPSDTIYANIDPIPYDWSNLANDVYSTYPFLENIVGRITGWDVQDASALVARTIFYQRLLSNLDQWKDNFGVLVGGGQDFQKPLLRYLIFGDLLKITPRGEPMKYPTGYGKICTMRTVDTIVEPMGFNTLLATNEQAMRQGLNEEALDKIKDITILNKLFFLKPQVRRLIGEGKVNGGQIMENSNFIWANAHGNQHMFGMAGTELTAAGFGGPVIYNTLKTILPIAKGGFIGPGTSLSAHGDYTTRSITGMKFGPSFMWLESCICGKIDGVTAQESVGQALLHAGVTSLIASPTGSNIGGGYLEPKNRMYDTPFSVLISYIKAMQNARKGMYPDPHFGYKIYTDLCMDLKDNNVSIGLAFRNAKNNYLKADADWELWWSPPLISTGDMLLDYEIHQQYADRVKNTARGGKGPMLENKYISFQEYLLFGDPAFNPYEPINEGKRLP
ncbi:MAG: C25 family cysteine peptidase [Candidatus Thermoplasmatota archaeon]